MTMSLDILRMAQSFAAHAATRQHAVSQNIANANTPGYRSRDVVPFSEFHETNRRGGETIRLEARPATFSPDGNTVSLEREMMRSAEVRQQHELALGVYSTARDILRAAIAKR